MKFQLLREENHMATNIKSNRKYLLLIPLLMSLVMLTFLSAAYDEIIHEMRKIAINLARALKAKTNAKLPLSAPSNVISSILHNLRLFLQFFRTEEN